MPVKGRTVSGETNDGRTGRAGNSGVAITLYEPRKANISKLEREVGVKFEHVLAPQPSDIVRAAGLDAAEATLRVSDSVIPVFKSAVEDLLNASGLSPVELLAKALAKSIMNVPSSIVSLADDFGTPILEGLDSSRLKKSMLVVSEFIGCSPSLSGAIRVNPWDIDSFADAMDNAFKVSDIHQLREINSPSLNIDGLSRLMMFMVHRQMFDLVHRPDSIEPLYSLNMCSKWLVHNSKTTITPLAMMVTDSPLFSPFFNLSKSIAEGGTTMMKTFGVDFWDFLSANPQANNLINEAMSCRTRLSMAAIMSDYKFDELKGILADVGGGIGVAINEIVNAYPHLKGINFDMPHVISTAPTYKGVTHVEGDMFKAITSADSILLKGDNECIKILKNCRDAIPKKTGKIIIVDIILRPGGDDVFDDTRIVHYLSMLACFERTEVEWKKILSDAGFSRYNAPTFLQSNPSLKLIDSIGMGFVVRSMALVIMDSGFCGTLLWLSDLFEWGFVVMLYGFMSPPIRRKYHDSVAFATGCKRIKNSKRCNRKIRIPIAMWPCRVKEKMTSKEVDG
ncbi:xanthohumol 4-O-methyltransferase-like protein [Tanacetum coccineum]